MTISRKERMLHIIEQLQVHSEQLPQAIKTNLQQAKAKLNKLHEFEVQQLTDKVFSQPVSKQQIDLNSPENLLHSCYTELERLSMEDHTPYQLQEAVKDMRQYFSIEEQDGFFP